MAVFVREFFCMGKTMQTKLHVVHQTDGFRDIYGKGQKAVRVNNNKHDDDTFQQSSSLVVSRQVSSIDRDIKTTDSSC